MLCSDGYLYNHKKILSYITPAIHNKSYCVIIMILQTYFHWVTHSVNIGYKNISFYVSRNKLNVTSIPISYRSFRVFSSIIDADRSVTNVTNRVGDPVVTNVDI
jgi:hypothetical protein